MWSKGDRHRRAWILPFSSSFESGKRCRPDALGILIDLRYNVSAQRFLNMNLQNAKTSGQHGSVVLFEMMPVINNKLA